MELRGTVTAVAGRRQSRCIPVVIAVPVHRRFDLFRRMQARKKVGPMAAVKLGLRKQGLVRRR